ncbi:hypothetical protein Enr13x_66760 [Stieleria neptunia]|uniref:Uncharacterized protein n=1 Tax=Stieleria neptunia TaxID=2527979 RepID=A0A518I168_9BACT|nr:hypothetical protein [Stieleria neptunia]QDV46767.1 hypothetical protein Enr13x_66760 [Stieleria neptunia]
MRRIDEDEYVEIVPLADYLENCKADLDLADTIEDLQLQDVYINGDRTFGHVLLYYGKPNCYLVIITDYTHLRVYGHHLLDLNEKYGATAAR